MDEERLIVSLEARIRDFERNMKKAERTGTTSYQRLRRDSRRSTTAMERDMIRSTTRINQAVATTSTKIGLLGKAFAAGAIAAGTTALTRSATQAVRSLAELGQQAERAGVSVQAFQELKFVGEQNRISVDAMTDGLKELQLRADEFIVTGKGPAAEAFARLGYEARDLKRRLEDPTELFADLIGRMEDLDRAAQIRVADEIFGGSAGERFVQLLDEGERGIREMTQRAHEMGAVVDSEVIARAEELDRKFAEIQARISTMAKTAVVNLASAIQGAVSIDVDEIFGSAERAIAMLGEEGYQALRDIERLTDTQRQSAESLSDVYHGLAGDIRTLARLLDNEVAVVLEQGLDQAAVDLATITDEMRRLVTEFEAGRISAEEFEQGVSAAEERAQGLASELAAVDGQTFASVIGGISGISAALGRAFETARALRAELPGQDGELSYGPQNGRPNNALPGPNAPRSSPRPRAAPPTAALLPGTPARSGGSSGGGREAFDPLEAIREQIAEQERLRKEIDMTEAAVISFRAEQEALTRAKAEGIPVTDELRAAISAEAEQLRQAADATLEAEARQERMVDLQRELASTAADWVMGLGNAEDALRSLARQLVEVGLQAALAGLFPGTFQMPALFTRATGGPVRAGQPYLVNERTPRSEVFVPGQGGAILNVPQAQAALRQGAGGGGGAVMTPTVNVPVNIVTLPGAEPEVRPRSDGRVDIDMAKAIEQLLASGRLDRGMRARFGATPVGRGS